MQPGSIVSTLLPMVVFQNMSQGPPSSLLQVAVKNNQQPVWYFNDKISIHVFFTDDGRMERANFLEVKLMVAISFIYYHYYFVGGNMSVFSCIVYHKYHVDFLFCLLLESVY